jgi:hypothetical protein
MADNLDTSATLYEEWDTDQRAWIHLYYKLLYQARLTHPDDPTCISDAAAFVAFQAFFCDTDETGSLDRAESKAMFIQYRNAALPNLLTFFMQEYNIGRLESDSRVSVASVYIDRAMLSDYIKICEKDSLDNDDAEPWMGQVDLWEFILGIINEKYASLAYMCPQDTVVATFVRATADNIPTSQQDTNPESPMIPSTDPIDTSPQEDPPKVRKAPTKRTRKRTKRDKKNWLTTERHALWRSINRWCNENGVDAFQPENMDKAIWNAFAGDVNAECAPNGQLKQRTGDNVESQVKDAIRRVNAVANKPIRDLHVSAEKMREEIGKGERIADARRYPEEAIEIEIHVGGGTDQGSDEDVGGL